MADEAEFTGGCGCRAVRYAVTGAPLWAAHCHCADCRRTTGAAMATWVAFPRDRFAVTGGSPADFASSPGVRRRFCGRCGTPLTYEGERWSTEVHVLAGTLDDPAGIAPEAHAYTRDQMPWLKLADDLPRFATVPSEGGPERG